MGGPGGERGPAAIGGRCDSLTVSLLVEKLGEDATRVCAAKGGAACKLGLMQIPVVCKVAARMIHTQMIRKH